MAGIAEIGLQPTQSPIEQAAAMLLGKNLKRDYKASGNGTSTTGSMTSGSKTLTLNAVNGFVTGRKLTAYGFGANTGGTAIAAPAEPTLGQKSGSSSFTANQQVYVGITWGLPNGETAMSPVASITITTAGNEITMTTVDLPFGVHYVGIYVGTTTTPLKLGNVVMSPYTYASYSGTSTSGISSSWVNTEGYQGLIGPWPSSTGALQMTIDISALASATGSSPPASGTTVVPTNTAPQVTAEGTTGSTTYKYYIVPLTTHGGAVAASAAGSTSSGNATLSSTNYNKLTWTLQNVPGYAVYGDSSNPSSSRGLLGFTQGALFYDEGAGSITAPHLPDTAPTSAIADYLNATIDGGGGTTTLTLDTAATTGGSGNVVYHRDSEALASALDDVLSGGGGIIALPAGTYMLDPDDLPNLDKYGQVLKTTIIGWGENSILQVLPGASGRPVFGQSSSYSTLYQEHFRMFELHGASNWGAFVPGWQISAQEMNWHELRVRYCYDGINAIGPSYTSPGYTGICKLSGLHVFHCAHVGIALPGDSILSNTEWGGNGQGTSADLVDSGVFNAGDSTIISNSHGSGDYVDLLNVGSYTKIDDVLFDDDAITHQLVMAGHSDNCTIDACTFRPASVQNSGYDHIHFEKLYSGGGQYNTIQNNNFVAESGKYAYEYCVREATGCDNNTIQNNNVKEAFYASEAFSLVGANDTVAKNPGYNNYTQESIDTEITGTSAQTIISYTPVKQALFTAKCSLEVVTAATTVTVTLTFTTPQGNSATYGWISSQSLALGVHALPDYSFAASTAGAIELKVTAGTANQVYATTALGSSS